MFQPQPTPFGSSFSPYGAASEPADFTFPTTPQMLQAGEAVGLASLAGPASAVPPRYSQSTPSSSVSPPAAASCSFANTFSDFNSPHVEMNHVKLEPGDALQSEMAAQEVAARQYQPDLQGPLVGEKTASTAITEEYAKADAVYVEKTAALPHTYSHYRPIQGDGNCGWRAIGFAYFETLISSFTKEEIDAERARISSLNNYLLTVGGYDITLFEDMVDETIMLLGDIADRFANPGTAMHLLTERFNDRDRSNAIIYHLRILAASWLKGNPALYEPFIPDGIGISGYCTEVIERPDKEIEHLGIILLVNVLLKPVSPVGVVLEIAYLDRSPGSQVNIYRFPEEANASNPENLGPFIYLLYRPDHYDILYKPPPPSDIRVHKAALVGSNHEILSTPAALQFSVDFSPLALLPGFGMAPSGLDPLSPLEPSPLGGSFAAAPESPWFPSDLSLLPSLQSPPPPGPAGTPAPTPASAPPPALAPAPAVASAAVAASAATSVNYPVRFSREHFKFAPEDSRPFLTQAFKNSHFNKAHYANPNFTPEEWVPDGDTQERKVPHRKGRL